MAAPMPASFRHDGITIAYERAGEGPPLVLVHGAAGDARLWRPQLDALADEFTVIAWDEPGAGRSSDLPAGFGLTDFADCLGGLVEATGVGPAHLCGLSWGGTVVLELYRRRPDLIRTLILADTYAGWKGSLPPRLRSSNGGAMVARRHQRALKTPAPRVPRITPGAVCIPRPEGTGRPHDCVDSRASDDIEFTALRGAAKSLPTLAETLRQSNRVRMRSPTEVRSGEGGIRTLERAISPLLA